MLSKNVNLSTFFSLSFLLMNTWARTNSSEGFGFRVSVWKTSWTFSIVSSNKFVKEDICIRLSYLLQSKYSMVFIVCLTCALKGSLENVKFSQYWKTVCPYWLQTFFSQADTFVNKSLCDTSHFNSHSQAKDLS